MFEQVLPIVVPALIAVALLVVLGATFSRLYKRSTKEVSFVRTGFGGETVIVDGGGWVIPILHDTISVGMNTLKLEVSRRGEDSLIARDCMRIDVVAAFFVRVGRTTDSVAMAAQTLGSKTLDAEALRELVEDKFVGVLRATAATMTMMELQVNRAAFRQAVQEAAADDLEKNGLELETVSITSLDQSAREYFRSDNAFDAEGLARLAEVTESRRMERNTVEQETETRIRATNLTAQRERLDIEKQERLATLAQQEGMANAAAEQAARVAVVESERKREASLASITAEREIKEATIAADLAVEQREIERGLELRRRQIDASRQTSVLEAEQRQIVEVADQDAQIAIADKSKEQSQADAAANLARAEAVKAEESVTTAREVATAERVKSINLIEASREAEKEALGVTITAQAQRNAAEDRAEAIRTVALAQRDGALAEAEGVTALNEARNKMGPDQVAMTVRMKLFDSLPGIIGQMVKPVEKIESIRIFQASGMPGMNGGTAGIQGPVAVGSGAPSSLPEQAMNAALSFAIAKPLQDAMMREAGIDSSSYAGLTSSLVQLAAPGAGLASAVAPVSPVDQPGAAAELPAAESVVQAAAEPEPA